MVVVPDLRQERFYNERKEAVMKKEQQILVDRLNQLCKKQGYSYYILAYKSSVPLSTLMHIMEGRVKNPGIFTIIKICSGLGITLGELFFPEELTTILESLEEES